MAKQKPFHTKVVQKIKRDTGSFWTGQFVDIIKKFTEQGGRLPSEAKSLLGDRPLCLQQEALVSMIYEEYLYDEHPDEIDEYPFIFPGIMLGWETCPKTLDLDAEALGFAKSADIDLARVRVDLVKRLFPGCVLVDTRGFGLCMYGASVDALFAYPSYDIDRDYPMVLLLGVNLKRGLYFPIESKLILKGDNLEEALAFSDEERLRLRRRCLSGLDKGFHDEAFSPLRDERALLELACGVFGFVCGENALVEERAGGGVLRILVSLRKEGDRVDDGSPLDFEPPSDPRNEIEEETGKGGAPSEGAPDSLLKIAVEEPICPDSEIEAGGGKAPFDYEQALTLVEELQAENDKLKAALDAERSQVASLGYHLRQAQASAEKAKAEAASVWERALLVESMDLPATAEGALALAERAFSDRIVVLSEARKSAGEFERGSAKEVWAVLRSIATALHRLVFDDNSGNIAYAFEAETGFEVSLRDVKQANRNSGYAKERQVLYEGRPKDITPHVKGRSVKKGECLRVHFFADYEKGKIVIAHCGEHLTTIKTSVL